jgi:heterotetrameric sarcosine oxidase delta subunit
MLEILCPWCGPRPESEFICLGEAGPPRPDPAALGDRQWEAHVVGRANIRGLQTERWWHVRSCGRISAFDRDTVTHEMTPARAAEPGHSP